LLSRYVLLIKAKNTWSTLQREIMACILLAFFGRRWPPVSLDGTANTARKDAVISGRTPSRKPNGRRSDEVNSDKGKAK
jgi:hypothetical protein